MQNILTKNKKFIPMLDLTRQYKKIKSEIDKAIKEVVSSGRFILGSEVENFEKEAANYLGVKFAIGVNSGTDALHLALKALGIGKGAEVITTSFTFIATAEVIALVGAKPVFADIEEKTFNINPNLIEKKITKNTKAIMPVHIYGQSANMDKILDIAKKYNLKVIEDCAQSFGSEFKGKKTGTFGEIGCFSFFPTKNLGCYGDGGLAVTNDEKLADIIRQLRVHGSKTRYYHNMIGLNSRLDALQAAILRVKLKRINDWNKERQNIAHKYNQLLSDTNIVVPFESKDATHVYHQYTIRTSRRNELQEYLKSRGIDTMIYYPLTLHLQPAFEYLDYKKGDLPATEMLQEQVLSLPIFPELTDNEIKYIAKCIKEFKS